MMKGWVGRAHCWPGRVGGERRKGLPGLVPQEPGKGGSHDREALDELGAGMGLEAGKDQLAGKGLGVGRDPGELEVGTGLEEGRVPWAA